MAEVATQAPPKSPERTTGKSAVTPAARPKGGKIRRASANSRIFGHMMAQEAAPRVTWAVGILKLEQDPGGDKLRDTLWERMSKMARFRSRMVVSRWGGHWEELPEAELLRLRDSGYLWSEVLTDGTATDEDVLKLVAQTDSWQYDRHAPLWRCQYVRKMADGSATLITTINHGIGDGISLVATLLTMCDDAEELMKVDPKTRGSVAAVTKRKKAPPLGPVSKARAFSYGVFQGLTSSKWKPDPPNFMSMPDVTKPADFKKVHQGENIPLEEFKKIRAKFGNAVTLNDIMMAVLTATVRAYLEEEGDPAAKGNQLVRGGFPINLRSPDEPILRDGDPMNKWAYGMFKFDFKYKNRIDLVWKVKRQVDEIKVSPSPLIQYRLVKVLTRALPRSVLIPQLLNAANLTTAQLSNVPGPQVPVHLAGARVTAMSFQLFTVLGLYIGLMSFAGQVSASFCADGSTKTDVVKLAAHWKKEFEALKKEVEAYPDGVPVPPRRWL